VTITMNSHVAVLVLWDSYMDEGGFPEDPGAGDVK